MLIQVNKDKRSINILEDKKLSIVLLVPVIVLTGQYFVLVLNELLGTLNISIVQNVSKIIVAIMFIYALPIVLKRIIFTFVSVYLGAIFIFLSNFVIFPENQQYIMSIVFPFFFMCLPAFIYSLCIDDWNIMKSIMRKAGLIVFCFGTAIGFLVFIWNANIGDYSMTLSYYMLLPAIIFLDELLDKPALQPFVVTILSLFIILALGSRGAIICIIIFVVLKIIRPNFKMNLIRIFFYILMIFTGIFTIAYLDKVLGFIYNLFVSFGIKSRTLELFLFDVSHLSGRDAIYQNVMEGIVNSPFLGIGIGGDRRVNGGEGFYAHNLFLELFSSFGVFIGSILIATLMFMILKILFSKDKRKYNLAIIWLSLGFIPLMLSSSYLTDINFWIFIGLITNHFFKSK